MRLGDGHQVEAELAANSTAQKWLKAKHCDLLVWGRAKDAKVLSLRFTIAETGGFEPKSYRLTDEKLELPIEFISDLGAAIATRLDAKVTAELEKRFQYRVPAMRAAAERMEMLVKSLNPNYDADTRGALLLCYAATQLEGAASNNDLEDVVATYREALKELSQERSSLGWASAQLSLGVALSTLGEREAGTIRLEEAVAAFREALKEFTRKSMPLGWALTQSNLGVTLSTLGERMSDTSSLSDLGGVSP